MKKKSVPYLFLMATVCVLILSCHKDFNAGPSVPKLNVPADAEYKFFKHQDGLPAYEKGVMLVETPNATIEEKVKSRFGKKVIGSTNRKVTKSKTLFKVAVDDVPNAVAQAKREGLKAQPNFVYVTQQIKPQATYPNDSFWTVGPDPLWGLRAIHADSVWANGNFGSSDVVCFISDQGFYGCHPDLAGNTWHNPGEIPLNGIDDDGNGYVDDVEGYNFAQHIPTVFMGVDRHGTHVAGTVGAIGNNGKGVIGVSPHVRFVSLKFLDGIAGAGYTSDAVESFYYAIDLKKKYNLNAPVITGSWGGGGFDQSLLDAIKACAGANIICNFAAGNSYGDNDDPTQQVFPASYTLYGADNQMTIGAADWGLNRAAFSNIGRNANTMFAPGTGILSTTVSNHQPVYEYFSGTSMATPHVAGAICLYAAIHKNAPYREIIDFLKSHVTDVPALHGLCQTGGLLNVAAITGQTAQDQPGTECFSWPQDTNPPTAPEIVLHENGIGFFSVDITKPATDDKNLRDYWGYVKKSTGEEYWYQFYGYQWTQLGFGGLPVGDYTVTVWATDEWGNNGAQSNIVNGTSLPDNEVLLPPTNVSVISVDSTSVTVMWEPNLSQYVGYYSVHYRRVGETVWQISNTLNGNWYHNDLTGLSKGTNYEAYVTSVRNVTGTINESVPSNTTTWKTLGDGTILPKPIINSFTANPSIITVGGSSTLSWSTTGAATVSIDNVGNVSPNGSTTVFPGSTTTYTLTATNANGSTTAQVTVTINPIPPTEISIILSGQNSILNWTITGATNPIVTLQRKNKSNQGYTDFKVVTGTNSYSIPAKPPKAYWYRIKLTQDGKDYFSNEVNL